MGNPLAPLRARARGSGAHNEVSLRRGGVNGRTDNCGPLQFDHTARATAGRSKTSSLSLSLPCLSFLSFSLILSSSSHHLSPAARIYLYLDRDAHIVFPFIFSRERRKKASDPLGCIDPLVIRYRKSSVRPRRGSIDRRRRYIGGEDHARGYHRARHARTTFTDAYYIPKYMYIRIYIRTLRASGRFYGRAADVSARGV